jgi:peptide/nickel transport system permease protein
MAVIRDLFRSSPSFRIGSIILAVVLVLVVLSFFSPYEPDDRRAVPRNQPPSTEFILGTTSTGQDVFWMLTYAVRNTLVVAGIAVIIGRSIGVMLGMLSGYIGGTFDRIASSIVDSFIVIPRLPLVILIAAILRGHMTLIGLAVLLGLLDWAYPSKRYRAPTPASSQA